MERERGRHSEWLIVTSYQASYPPPPPPFAFEFRAMDPALVLPQSPLRPPLLLVLASLAFNFTKRMKAAAAAKTAEQSGRNRARNRQDGVDGRLCQTPPHAESTQPLCRTH